MLRGYPHLRIALAALAVPVVAACAGGTAAARADLDTLQVKDAASFQTALGKAKAGDTIQLADGTYAPLVLDKKHFAPAIRVVGSRNARIGSITFTGSSGIVVQGITLTPAGSEQARILIAAGTKDITLDDIVVNGRDQKLGAFVETKEGTSDITIQNSDITNCGQKTGCIRPAAANLRVLKNHFFDCRSCIFIKGGTDGATITGNTFSLATPGSCTGGQLVCPHNDLIAIFGGGPWMITGNRFGQIRGGTAQIYMNPGASNHDRPIHDVFVASNIFTGDLGYAIRVGVGGKAGVGPPKNVRIINNTILSGKFSSVHMNPPWKSVPKEQQPIVANNILGKLDKNECDMSRTSHNLILSGAGCASTDHVGQANLAFASEVPVPTPSSTQVIDRADPTYAPKTDFFGNPRKGVPDIGAIEFSTAFAQLKLGAPSSLSRRLSAVRAGGWRLVIPLTFNVTENLRVRLLVKNRIILTTTRRVSGKTHYKLVILLPAKARKAGSLILNLTASASGMKPVTRSVRIRLVA
jgi:hypothetical protein